MWKNYPKIIGFLAIAMVALWSCENRDVNHADGPNFSEIHEDIQYHFDQIDIDGHQYYILERDRNNPHEGFGFMAMKADRVIQNQDSIKAYLKTMLEVQTQILAAQRGATYEDTKVEVDNLYLQSLQSSQTVRPPETEEAEE